MLVSCNGPVTCPVHSLCALKPETGSIISSHPRCEYIRLDLVLSPGPTARSLSSLEAVIKERLSVYFAGLSREGGDP